MSSVTWTVGFQILLVSLNDVSENSHVEGTPVFITRESNLFMISLLFLGNTDWIVLKN